MSGGLFRVYAISLAICMIAASLEWRFLRAWWWFLALGFVWLLGALS